MNPEISFWLIAGTFLIFLELLIPGLVVMFLGLAAWIVAAVLYMEWITDFWDAVTIWFIASIFLTLSLREVFQKFIPGDLWKKPFDTDKDAVGEVALVTQDIKLDTTEGRISFQGTSWNAKTLKRNIKQGEQVKIVSRDNLIWVVEPVEDDS